MEMQEYLEEIFDLNPILPEIYTSSREVFSNPKSDEVACEDQAWKTTSSKQLMSRKPSSSLAPTPQLISFENSPNAALQTSSDYKPFIDADLGSPHENCSNVINFSSSVKDSSAISDQYQDASIGMRAKRVRSAARTPLQAQDHLMAERKRREKIAQLFITLSKLVPGLKKLDKASLLEDAINYLKALEERVSVLEEEEAKKSSLVAVREDSSSSSKESLDNGTTSESTGPDIKARISNRNLLIKICCKKQKGTMSRIPREMEKMNLSVIDMRVMPFGGASLDITILAEMHSEFRGTVKNIVDQLEMVFLNSNDTQKQPH